MQLYDYLIIGPTIELRSLSHKVTLVGPVLQQCELQITQGDRTIGLASVVPSSQGLELRAQLDPAFDHTTHLEVLRLLARISGHLSRYVTPFWIASSQAFPGNLDALGTDGFVFQQERSAWVRGPGPFLVAESEKVDESSAVYGDFYSVPWSTVGREWDVLVKFARDVGFRPDVANPSLSHLNILDLGCGAGKNSTALEEMGFTVYGLDLSGPAIARAKQLVKFPDRYVEGSATELPWPEGFFDTVLDIGCLHCIPETLRTTAVAEVARVLKPRGTLYSRSFSPRDSIWYESLPFKCAEFGIPREQALGMMRPWFDTSLWNPDPNYNYILARRRDR